MTHNNPGSIIISFLFFTLCVGNIDLEFELESDVTLVIVLVAYGVKNEVDLTGTFSSCPLTC
jgi:hypothetical protein